MKIKAINFECLHYTTRFEFHKITLKTLRATESELKDLIKEYGEIFENATKAYSLVRGSKEARAILDKEHAYAMAGGKLYSDLAKRNNVDKGRWEKIIDTVLTEESVRLGAKTVLDVIGVGDLAANAVAAGISKIVPLLKDLWRKYWFGKKPGNEKIKVKIEELERELSKLDKMYRNIAGKLNGEQVKKINKIIEKTMKRWRTEDNRNAVALWRGKPGKKGRKGRVRKRRKGTWGQKGDNK